MKDNVIAVDTETALFGLGCMAPPLVCLSYDAGAGPQLLNTDDALPWFRSQLSGASPLAFQNGSYDLCVLMAASREDTAPEVFAALDSGRITDTKIREQLLAIASGDFDRLKFSLKDIASRRLGMDIEKGDVRVTFGKFRGVPLSIWPEAYREYAKKDAAVTRAVWLSQETDRLGTSNEFWQKMQEQWSDVLADETAQVQASVALQLATCWGMRTDPVAVTKLRGELQGQKNEFDAKLRAAGILRTDGSKNMAALKTLVEAAYGLEGPPLTDKGGVKTDRETLLDSGDSFLMDIAEGGKAGKYLSTYVPWLEAGTRGPINPSFEVLKVTGRTGCIAKGTLIEVVRDVAKFPKGIPIEDVRVDDLVYCYSSDGELEIKPVLAAGKTGHREIVRVHWQGSGHHHGGYVDLTPEHKIMLTSGQWIEARHLKPMHRVFALSRGTSQGYARLWATGNKEITREHRFIYEQLTGKDSEHVHHKNRNKLDNRFENLEPLDPSTHSLLHVEDYDERRREKHRAASKQRYAAGLSALRAMPGSSNPRWLGITLEDAAQLLATHRYSVLRAAQARGYDFDSFKRNLRCLGFDLQALKQRSREVRREEIAASAAHARSVRLANNHEIVAVETLSEKVDVYDLTVQDNPNFIANEICVHNSREPNIQNFPVKGGLRECFIPRPGFVFVDADYSTLELRTLAQSCLDLLGHSSMADALIREHAEGGPDLHSLLAGKIYGVSGQEIFDAYNAGDKEAAEKRKLAKAPNFGFPGGMGVDKFVMWAKAAYKVLLTRERASELKEAYLAQWPEISEFFALIGQIVGESGEGAIRLPRSKRVHGGKWFSEMCNLMFQGPAADGAKAAFYEVQKRCYAVKDSALYGSRGVAFIHDEILLECPKSRARAAERELCEIMVQQMKMRATPDLPVAVDSAILERWGA